MPLAPTSVDADAQRREASLNLEPLGLDPRRFGIFAVAALVFGLLAWRYRFVVMDDPYITFRYARNVLQGHGWVFNPGEPLEGYSNFLWTVLSMVPIGLGVEVLGAMRVLGVLIALLVFGVLAWGRHRWSALLLASCYPFAVWAGGGLETVSYAALVFAVVLLTIRLAERPSHFAAVALGLAVLGCALSRPEGAVAALVPCALLLGKPRAPWKLIGLAGGVFLVPFAIYTAWRFHTFGTLIPNTVTAKVGGSPLTNIKAGFGYLGSYFLAPPVILLGLAGWGLWKAAKDGGRVVVAAVLLWLLPQFVFILGTGGDWMPGMRFLVPMLPVLAWAAARGLEGSPEWLRTGTLVVLVLSAPIFARWEEVHGHRFLEWSRRNALTPDGSARELIIAPVDRIGRDVAVLVGDGRVLALTEAGVIPWHARGPAIDMLGLVDTEIAQVGGALHQAHDGSLVLRRKPDFILLGVTNLNGEERGLWPPDQQILLSPDFAATYREVHRWPRPFYQADLRQMPGHMVLYERRAEPHE